MTRKRYEELTRAGRHRVVAGVLLRAAAAVALLVVGYYVAPLDRPLDTGTLIEFLLALAVVGAVIAWEVRNILTSDVPRLRAVQTVAVGVPMLLLVFASVYVQIETSQPNSFSETLSRTDALYFTVTVFATVGFGDITATSEPARALVTGQMVAGIVIVGLGARIIVDAIKHGREQLPVPPRAAAIGSADGAAADGPAVGSREADTPAE